MRMCMCICMCVLTCVFERERERRQIQNMQMYEKNIEKTETDYFADLNSLVALNLLLQLMDFRCFHL